MKESAGLHPPPDLDSSQSKLLQRLAEKTRAEIDRLRLIRDQRRDWNRLKGSPLWWLRNLTETFDKQWEQNNLPGPYNHFPDDEYLDWVFAFLGADNEWLKGHGLPPDAPGKKRRILPKSRTMMISWSVVGYYEHRCETIPQTQVLLQSQNQSKANDLIEYAKCLYIRQPEWLREKFPLSRPYEEMPMHMLEWANGSSMEAIPQGADVVTSFHPTALVMDEAARQLEGEKAVHIALPAVPEVVLISSAYPGWFGEFIDADTIEEL